MSGKEKFLRPSSARIWLEGGCGGSLDLRKWDEGSVYAAEGTQAHECASAILQGYPQTALRCQGCHVFTDVFPCPECGHEHSYHDVNRDEMLTAVRKYTNYVNDIRNTKAVSHFGVEQQMEHPELTELGGTIDCAMVYADQPGGLQTVHVLDYKHGAGVWVPVEANPQMMSYLMIFLANLRVGGVIGEAFPTLKMTIAQPRSYVNDDEHGVMTVEVTAEAMHEFTERVFEAAYNREFKAGPHCRMCSSITYCPLMRDAAEDVIDLDIDAEPTADWIRLYEVTDGLRKLLDLIPARLSQAMQNGLYVDGFKLVRAQGNSTWRLSGDELLAELKKIGVGKNLATTRAVKVKSPTQIREVIKKRPRLKNASLDELAFRPNKGLIVVPEHDRREAVQTKSLDELYKGEEDYVETSNT